MLCRWSEELVFWYCPQHLSPYFLSLLAGLQYHCHCTFFPMSILSTVFLLSCLLLVVGAPSTVPHFVFKVLVVVLRRRKLRVCTKHLYCCTALLSLPLLHCILLLLLYLHLFRTNLPAWKCQQNEMYPPNHFSTSIFQVTNATSCLRSSWLLGLGGSREQLVLLWLWLWVLLLVIEKLGRWREGTSLVSWLARVGDADQCHQAATPLKSLIDD